MYFGSVRFFKHLIIGVLLLLIIIPTVICIVMGVKSGEKDSEIEALERRLAVAQGEPPNADELMEMYKSSTDKEAFLKLLSDYDKAFYTSFAAKTAPAQTSSAAAVSTPSASPSAASAAATTAAAVISAAAVSSTSAAATTATTTATTTTTTAMTTTLPEEEPDEAPAYQSLFPELYCRGTSDIVYDMDMDYLYLTFDDGPSQYTENILSYLRMYDVKATFFVVPNASEECAARLRKIADAGHTIGVHSATHEYTKIYASVEAYLEDFKTAYDLILNATGVKCELFRFPGGSINDFNGAVRDDIIAEMTRRGFIYFDWNVDSGDAAGATWTEMYNGVLEQVDGKNRAVILMHDHGNGYNTVLVLEDIIKALKNDARKFKFGRLTKTVKPIQF